MILGGDADPLIAHGDQRPPVGGRQLDHEGRGRLRVLGGVVEEVVEDAREQRRLGVDGRSRLESGLDPASGTVAAEADEGLFHQAGHVHPLAPEDERAAPVEPRRGQDVADQALELDHVLLDLAQVAPALLRLRFGRQRQRDPDAGQRGPQLVGDVGEQVTLRLQQPPQAVGHLVEGIRERSDLVAALEMGANGEVPLAQPPCHLAQMLDRTGDRARERRRRHGEHEDEEPQAAEEAQERAGLGSSNGDAHVASGARGGRCEVGPVPKRPRLPVEARELGGVEGRRDLLAGGRHAASVVRVDHHVDLQLVGEAGEQRGQARLGKRRHQAGHVLSQEGRVPPPARVPPEHEARKPEGRRHHHQQQEAVEIDPSIERSARVRVLHRRGAAS